MIAFFQSFWTKSIRRQLMLGIASVHAVLMTIFVVDLVGREHDFLIQLNQKQAVGLAETLAANGSSWVLANDVIGMEEVIKSQSEFPGLRYALFIDTKGKVLGFSDRTKVGMYMSDHVSSKLLESKISTQILIDNELEIDVAAPILTGQNHIGWARVSITHKGVLENIKVVTRNGIYYTILAIVIGTLFAWFMSKGLTSGLKKLVDGSKLVEKGEKEIDFNLDRQDELGHLSESMAAMMLSINTSQDKIRSFNRQLEDRVQSRTLELSHANEELKSFAYAVSHDLKAPLRAINHLAGWIEKDYSSAFDDDGLKKMSMLKANAKRMHEMIEGVLLYSRIGRVEMSYEEVDVDLLLTEIKGTLLLPDNVKFEVQDDLLTVYTDRLMLFQVLQNLFDNAIKYNDKDEIHISFKVVEQECSWLFSVKDNGLGIDKTQQSNVFDLFHTIPNSNNIDATGVGLSLVKKSILHCGGKITLESILNEGTEISFTIPKKRMEHE